MRRLIILPGTTDALGGTLVTLSLLIDGIIRANQGDRIRVLTQSGSLMEEYLTNAGQKSCLQLIEADNCRDFLAKSLNWIDSQPSNYPLWLDNCIGRELLGTLIKSSLKLRLSSRPIYFFFHDLGLSYNSLGWWARKLLFTSLNPTGFCNSYFTSSHVSKFVNPIDSIFYQPVDTDRFKPLWERPQINSTKSPDKLRPIIESGAHILLTPSRLNKPGIVNDKNLRGLIPVIAQLKTQGHRYHSVIIGEDHSSDGRHKRDLLDAADAAGVRDQITILPPVFDIENYYPYADIMITLAPREPFGRTVVEAIACGIPVIGSRSGGIGEILNHFASEWTVPPDDVVATAETILSVMESSQTQMRLEQARQWVKDCCSVDVYANNILTATGISKGSSLPERSRLPASYSSLVSSNG